MYFLKFITDITNIVGDRVSFTNTRDWYEQLIPIQEVMYPTFILGCSILCRRV